MDKTNLFDEAICDQKLQIMKTALPYIRPKEQKLLSLFIISEEMRNTINFYKSNNGTDDISICEIDSEQCTFQNMINDIRSILSEKETERLDNILNLINIIKIFKVYKSTTSNDAFASIRSLLTPEQQEMFEMYSSIMQGQAT